MKINSTTDIFGKEKISMPEKLSSLRSKLNTKAKKEPKFKFYALYDHVYRLDTLWTAWHLVRKNKGSAGMDGITIEQILEDEDGPRRLIDELHHNLISKTYRPLPVRRVYIPKKNGKFRPLGIPAVRDRIVQQATLLILEPIFEADFLDCSYGFRPNKSAHQALKQIEKNLKEQYTVVYDVDLKGYFDSIPHDKLMKCLEMRIADRSILQLIRLWLKTPIAEDIEGKSILTKGQKKGTPQGGVISPLLSNIYLHWFDKIFHRNGEEPGRANARLVRYADDYVVMYQYPNLNLIKWIEDKIQCWLGLEINQEKTRIIKLRKEGERLDFLGYSFKFVKSWKNKDKRFLLMFPSDSTISKEKDKIRSMLHRSMRWKETTELAGEVSRHVYGWSQYFCLGYCTKAYSQINYFLYKRAIQFLRKKSQRGYKFPDHVSYYGHLQGLGFRFIKSAHSGMV